MAYTSLWDGSLNKSSDVTETVLGLSHECSMTFSSHFQEFTFAKQLMMDAACSIDAMSHSLGEQNRIAQRRHQNFAELLA